MAPEPRAVGICAPPARRPTVSTFLRYCGPTRAAGTTKTRIQSRLLAALFGAGALTAGATLSGCARSGQVFDTAGREDSILCVERVLTSLRYEVVFRSQDVVTMLRRAPAGVGTGAPSDRVSARLRRDGTTLNLEVSAEPDIGGLDGPPRGVRMSTAATPAAVDDARLVAGQCGA